MTEEKRQTAAIQTIISRFEKIHGRSHRTVEELEPWLVSYADGEEGWRFIREVNDIITPGMTDEEAAERYLLKQAKKMLALFEEAHRRPARTTEELYAWTRSPEGKQWLALDSDDPNTLAGMGLYGHDYW